MDNEKLIKELAKEGLRRRLQNEARRRHEVEMARKRLEALIQSNIEAINVLGDPFEEEKQRAFERAEAEGRERRGF